jgi:hypothetical protein
MFRVTSYGLRVTGYELRVACLAFRVTGSFLVLVLEKQGIMYRKLKFIDYKDDDDYKIYKLKLT